MFRLPWPKRLEKRPYGESQPTNRERFTRVYETRRWATGESVSGPGSDHGSGSVEHTTRLLHRFIPELGVRSIADIPCGDFHWMGEVLSAHPDVRYVGYDIVAPLIARNWRTQPGRSFAVLDIVTEVPPAADLILCKDLVNHLYERDVRAALKNMVASGSTWLLITSNTGFENLELDMLAPGASRELDLAAPPYDLPPPVYGDHYLSLWRLEEVGRALDRP
jgi:hypothetical protein